MPHASACLTFYLLLLQIVLEAQVRKVQDCENFHCRQKEHVSATAAPLLSSDLLKAQIGNLMAAMQAACPNVMQRHAAQEADVAPYVKARKDKTPVAPPSLDDVNGKKPPAPPSTVTMLWRLQSSDPTTRDGISEYVKLAQIGLVIVGGSVMNEQVFSYLTNKNDLRRCLLEDHLNVCYFAPNRTTRSTSPLPGPSLPRLRNVTGATWPGWSL
jgi:hypothetical protein